MGLNILGDVVDVDHSHNRLLNTGRHGNPVIQLVPKDAPELTVFSAFRRHKAPNSLKRDRHSRVRGDNCHLLYALKGKDGLHTTFGAIRNLMLHFDAILEDMIDQSNDYHAIIAMPSSHAISRIYAKRLARRYRCDLLTGVFDKISVEMARQLLTASPLASSEKRRIAARLGTEGFSLKDIPVGFRSHFPPVSMRENALPDGYSRFLLADDLLSTGTTLVAARRLILSAIPSAQVDASCLFSAV